MNVLFDHLLERPTLKGRKVMDRLEGFRRFLGATEEDRFDRMQAPDRSLEKAPETTLRVPDKYI